MNRLSTEDRAKVVRCSVDGNSMRATTRITGIARNTVDKLLIELGGVCSEYQDRTLRNLASKRIQIDECWAFCFAKQKNVRPHHFENGGYAGDIWTWAAIDADTKLIPCWTLGQRDEHSAKHFVEDLASRLADRVQLTSDGLRLYLVAVEKAFRGAVDYTQLVKVYGIDPDGEKRYSPAICTACESHPISGDPDPKHISTSYIERANLTMRMGMRRNAHSKSVEHHAAAVSLHMMWYNFGRVHQTLKTTPAVKSNVADHVWSIDEVIGLLENIEPKSTRPAISN